MATQYGFPEGEDYRMVLKVLAMGGLNSPDVAQEMHEHFFGIHQRGDNYLREMEKVFEDKANILFEGNTLCKPKYISNCYIGNASKFDRFLNI